MIKSITIENFKGIGNELTIDLKPVTLLFGGNSAGKSSILHALQYVYEILDNRHLDAGRTQKGGNFIDLGGFKKFVHEHELNRTVRITIGCSELGDEFFTNLFEAMSGFLRFDEFNGGVFDCFAFFDTCKISISVSWSHDHDRPYVSKFGLVVEEQTLLEIESDPAGHRVLLDINDSHNTLATLESWDAEDEETVPVEEVFDDPKRSLLSFCLDEIKSFVNADATGRLYIELQKDALPSVEHGIKLAISREKNYEDSDYFESEKSLEQFVREFQQGLNDLITIPLQRVASDLEKIIPLGPLRETPPADFRPPRHPTPDRWATGLAAWDLLARDIRGHFVDEVNTWLADESRLNCGCSVHSRKEFVVDMASSTGQWLASGTGEIEEWSPEISAALVRRSRLVLVPDKNQEIELRASDVGTGISQLIPVVVAACLGEERRPEHSREVPGRLITIEQPELHVHPRIQAELGDLFIDAWQRKNNQFILETHSEHLILRLQRRVRENHISQDDIRVYYVSQADDGQTQVSQLRLDDEGDFIDDWPGGFFPERLKEI